MVPSAGGGSEEQASGLDIAPHHLINNQRGYKTFSGSVYGFPLRPLEHYWATCMALSMDRTWVSHYWYQCPHQPAVPRDEPTPYCLFHPDEGQGLVI